MIRTLLKPLARFIKPYADSSTAFWVWPPGFELASWTTFYGQYPIKFSPVKSGEWSHFMSYVMLPRIHQTRSIAHRSATSKVALGHSNES